MQNFMQFHQSRKTSCNYINHAEVIASIMINSLVLIIISIYIGDINTLLRSNNW